MTKWRAHELQVANVPLDELTRHPKNANQGDIEAIEESINVSGFYQPIVAQASTGYIIAGNHRWEVALKMGAETIPTIYVDVTDEEAERMMVADNRITRLGQDDPALLLDLLDDLSQTDYGLLGTGFDAAQFQTLLDAADKPLEFENEPDDDQSTAHTADPFLVDPIIDHGVCFTVTVIRKDGKEMQPEDFNRIREGLGLNRLARGVLAQYDIEGWE